jgi:hypothetical protein
MGTADDPRSFDLLGALLEWQAYRLASLSEVGGSPEQDSAPVGAPADKRWHTARPGFTARPDRAGQCYPGPTRPGFVGARMQA